MIIISFAQMRQSNGYGSAKTDKIFNLHLGSGIYGWYGNKWILLFTDTDNWLYKIEIKNVYEDFSRKKDMINFSNYFTVIQMPSFADEIASIATEEFIGIKLDLLDFNEKFYRIFKKQKSHGYKNVLLNKICLRHSMNRIQCKNHKIWCYEFNKISVLCFAKIYILDNGIYVSSLLNMRQQLS